MNSKYFQVETSNETEINKEFNRIVYFDINDKSEYFFNHNFEKEEAEYFVYVINGYINNNKNIIEIS